MKLRTSTKCHAVGYVVGVMVTYISLSTTFWPGILATLLLVIGSLRLIDWLGWGSPS